MSKDLFLDKIIFTVAIFGLLATITAWSRDISNVGAVIHHGLPTLSFIVILILFAVFRGRADSNAELALANMKLETTSRKFQSLFDGSRDGVILVDSEGKVVEANQAALEMSGYSSHELETKVVFDLLVERNRHETIDRFRKTISGELKNEFNEMSIVTKDGRIIPVEVISNVILSDDQVTILSTVRDISFRKQHENEKLNSALKAEERERARFSEQIHDELGPVFSTLKLYLQTLATKETDLAKKEIFQNLSGIVDDAVEQVREISHNISPYLLRDIGLTEAIRAHLKRFRDHESTLVDFEAHLEDKIRLTANIEIALYRIFLELLNNTTRHSGATKIKIHLSRNENEVIFDYLDNGKGFSPDMLSDPSGIGLKNIENRVQALNGSVRFLYREHEMLSEIRIPL